MTAAKLNPHQVLGDDVQSASSYLAGVSPNASVVIAVSVVADLTDVLAVLRTAALLARSFRTKLSVDIPGMKDFVVSPVDAADQMAVQKMLDSIQAHVDEDMSSGTRVFMMEVNLTAASFLTIGNIAVRVHTGDSVQRSK
jgi:hypothetical protein